MQSMFQEPRERDVGCLATTATAAAPNTLQRWELADQHCWIEQALIRYCLVDSLPVAQVRITEGLTMV